jgi:hypothetical protein
LQDVRNLQVPANYAAFIEAALKLRGQRRHRIPAIDFDSVQELLRTASRAFPVITIHCETVAPEICNIGRVIAVSDSQVSLLEIGPDACWDNEALSYRTKEITRVDFGGDHEEALTLVDNLYANRRKKVKRSLWGDQFLCVSVGLSPIGKSSRFWSEFRLAGYPFQSASRFSSRDFAGRQRL